MLINYVGNFAPNSTETHISRTLEGMGHSVTRIQEKSEGEINVSQALQCDLFLWTRTWSGFVTEHALDELRASEIPSVSYHLDLYVGISRERDIPNDPFWKTDYVFSTDGDPHSEEVFKRLGINHYWLPAAVVADETNKGILNHKYKADVAFIGSAYNYHEEWDYRQQLHQYLATTYQENYKLFGQFPRPAVRGKDLNDCLASVKVVVGDSLCKNFTHEKYWSDRLYETIGRGGFTIFPYIKGLETQFILEGKDIELVTYEFGNFAQLKYLIDYFLQNDELREIIREKGYQKVINNYTYKNRMENILDVIGLS